MAQRSSSGGCIALVAILIAAAVGAVLLFVIFFTKRASSHSSMIREMAESAELVAMTESGEERLVFTEANRPRMSVPAPGEPVTLELFAAYMIDSDATELAKDSFRKVAEKSEVSWRMRLQQLTGRKGPLRGDFDVPWQIRHGNGSSGSSFQVGVTFDEAGREALLNLRRGDWVTVEGQLTVAGGSVTIENAVVADAPVAEKP